MKELEEYIQEIRTLYKKATGIEQVHICFALEDVIELIKNIKEEK